MNDTAFEATPRIVAWLGYGGLIPFLTLASMTCVDRERGALWHGYLADYGAVILSFVGALHWGFAMASSNVAARKRTALFAWSVVPCMIAFASLAARFVPGDVLLIIGFLLHYRQDWKLAAFARMPAWYLPLRLRLSAVAVICIAAGAFSRGW